MRMSKSLLLVLLVPPMVSCLREPPDRTLAVQGPLILFVLAAPALSFAVRRRHRALQVSLLAMQVAAYVVYETGVSIETNIRIDLPLILGAVGLNVWLATRTTSVETQRGVASNLDAVPPDRTKCEACGEEFPSNYYLQAAGSRGYICEKCAKKS